MKWLPLAGLLMASTAAAQPQPPVRQRQDRRASLPATPSEPMLEVYVATNNLTSVTFNGALDRDSLVLDRTRFKWVDVGDRTLTLEPFADLGPGEKLIMQVGFKDRALPSKAVLAVLSKADVMDGKVEVDRRANTPEALLAALKQKEVELEEFKARYSGSGPSSLALSGWLHDELDPVILPTKVAPDDTSGLTVLRSTGYPGNFSALVVLRVRNLPGQKPWAPGQARLSAPAGASATVLSVQMKQEQLAPGEEALVVVEAKTPPWTAGEAPSIDLVDVSGQRRLSLYLTTRSGGLKP